MLDGDEDGPQCVPLAVSKGIVSVFKSGVSCGNDKHLNTYNSNYMLITYTLNTENTDFKDRLLLCVFTENTTLVQSKVEIMVENTTIILDHYLG